MALTLSECFEYAGLALSDVNETTIREVRKILQLEMKSSGEDSLVIGGENYSLNDILQFFEHAAGEHVPDAADVGEVHSGYSSPWHEVLAKPEGLSTFFTLSDELLDPEMREQAKQLVEHTYGKEILKSAQRQLRDDEYDKLQYLLSYVPVFSYGLLYDLRQSLLSLMTTKMLRLEEAIRKDDRSGNFRQSMFFSRSFYTAFHFFHESDASLGHRIAQLGIRLASFYDLTWPERYDFFELLLLLPQDEDSKAALRSMRAQSHQKMSEGEVNVKAIVVPTTRLELVKEILKGGLGIIILAMAGFFTYYYFTGKPEKKKPSAEEQLLDNKYKDHYFNKEDVISDYTKLKAGIESNVYNLAVRGFLVNELGRFVYDQDIDTAYSELTYQPVKPFPGCIPFSVSNDSKFSNILVLIFDEEDKSAPVRGAYIAINKEFLDTVLYVAPTDRVIVLARPVIRNGNTVVSAKMASLDDFNVLYESVRVKRNAPRRRVYISYSEFQQGEGMITYDDEEVSFKRLHRKS